MDEIHVAIKMNTSVVKLTFAITKPHRAGDADAILLVAALMNNAVS
jgi:hypothetical protein